jgi:PKD repeat protein
LYRTIYSKLTDKSNNTTGTDTYFWEFGDGSTSSVRNPSYTYTKSGTFNVSLTVTKPNGCKAKKTFDAFIKIGELSPNFSADKTKGGIPTKINFTNSTSPTSKNITFEWDFGDGTQKSGLQCRP